MKQPGKTDTENKDLEAAALLSSAIIIGGSVFYWVIQIQAVQEMLALAYG